MRWRDGSAPATVAAHETTTRHVGAVYPLLHDVGHGTPGVLIGVDLLGGLFSSRTSQQNLDETLFFITPKLVHPDDIYAQDIAQRNYLLDQREKMREMRRDIQGQSQLLRLNPGTLAEDE